MTEEQFKETIFNFNKELDTLNRESNQLQTKINTNIRNLLGD